MKQYLVAFFCTYFLIITGSQTPYFPSSGPFISHIPIGELGNQLFEAATGISLALDNGCRYVLPEYAYKRYIGVFWRVPHANDLKGDSFYDETFYPTIIPFKQNLMLNGYFQSYKYFDHHRKEIVQLFGPSKEKEEYIYQKYGAIFDKKITVGLHIRTYYKDFMSLLSEKERAFVENSSGFNGFFDINGFNRIRDSSSKIKKNIIQKASIFYGAFPGPDINFIKQAMDHFPQDAVFIVCTDNMLLAKGLLSGIEKNFVFMEGEDCVTDFYILSLCNHNITSNSTFSWWAAYINEHEDKVIIAPDPFYTDKNHKIEDMYPLSWILVKLRTNILIPAFSATTLLKTNSKTINRRASSAHRSKVFKREATDFLANCFQETKLIK